MTRALSPRNTLRKMDLVLRVILVDMAQVRNLTKNWTQSTLDVGE